MRPFLSYLRPRSLLAAVAAAALAVSPIVAQPIKVNVDEKNVGINGYDPVAYFTLGKPTKGDARYAVTWEDARWHFVSAEHRDMFVRDPDRYAPRFGGFCALGMSRGFLSIVDPEAWQIVENRLFLAYDKRNQEIVAKDARSIIERAEKNWQSLGPR